MAKPLYVYTGSQWVPVASELESTSQYLPADQAQAPFRNLIINGAMQVAQRGTSVSSITSAGYRTADRWNNPLSSAGTWTQSVENDAPTGSGFRKSLKMLCTTADSSLSASDYISIAQAIEGQNLQAIKKGTANAEQLTFSFWVKSNVTGTYILGLYDADNNRAVSQSYQIVSSGTWEKKTIVFPADTTGAFDNDNAGSLYIDWWLGTGSDFNSGTLQTTWGSYVAANRAAGQTNLASATNNYWQITGVQLEVGAVATPFEFKPYAQDLLECQRYYWRTVTESSYGSLSTGLGMASSTTGAEYSMQHPVTMRSAVTALEFSAIGPFHPGTGILAATSSTLATALCNKQFTFFTLFVASGLTQYRPTGIAGNNNTAGYLAFSAEL